MIRQGLGMYRIIWIFILFAAPTFCKLEDHFKRAEGKSSIHTMRNIDFIYMINLDPRPEKFAKSTAQLHSYQIYPYRFSAVNGWELTLETINDVGVRFEPGMKGGFWGTSYLTSDFAPIHGIIENVGQVYFCHCMGRGPIGIVLSHLSILQDALDSGYKTIWVMEDDIEVIKDPRCISDLIEELDNKVGKKNWDILFTDQDTKNQQGQYVPSKGFAKSPNFEPSSPEKFAEEKRINSKFRRIGARYGAYSMIVRRSGMKKILNYCKEHNIFLPYDMMFQLPEGMKLVTVRKDVVSTEIRALSDNGGPNYLNK